MNRGDSVNPRYIRARNKTKNATENISNSMFRMAVAASPPIPQIPSTPQNHGIASDTKPCLSTAHAVNVAEDHAVTTSRFMSITSNQDQGFPALSLNYPIFKSSATNVIPAKVQAIQPIGENTNQRPTYKRAQLHQVAAANNALKCLPLKAVQAQPESLREQPEQRAILVTVAGVICPKISNNAAQPVG